MVRVLLVCMGNICRSPMAEGVLRHLADAEGLAVEIESAGTTRHHAGEPPDSRAQATMRDRGIDISGQTARHVKAEDLDAFDYVIAMDRDNLSYLERLARPDRLHRLSLLLDHAPDTFVDEVPDPYYGGEEGFTRALDLIERGAKGLIAKIRRDQG